MKKHAPHAHVIYNVPRTWRAISNAIIGLSTMERLYMRLRCHGYTYRQELACLVLVSIPSGLLSQDILTKHHQHHIFRETRNKILQFQTKELPNFSPPRWLVREPRPTTTSKPCLCEYNGPPLVRIDHLSGEIWPMECHTSQRLRQCKTLIRYWPYLWTTMVRC